MQFVNPFGLYFLFAALIPVIVHLFRLQRYKRVYFSNVRLLQQINTQQKRNARLREYAVLAARILTVLCLVLAFAQPYLPPKDTVVAGKYSRVSIYMDNSFSMQAPAERSVLLEKAKEQVRRILRVFPADASVHFLTNEFKGEDQAFFPPARILEKLDQIDYCAIPRSLSEVQERQRVLFNQAGVAAGNRLCYYVSDFQKTGFDLRAAQDTLSVQVFVPVRGEDYINVSLDSASLDTPVLQAGRDVPLRVFLQNRSDKEQWQLPLRLFVGESQVGAYPVDLEAGERKEMLLPLHIEKSGNLQGFVEIADYPMQFDNRLYFSLQVPPQIKVFHLYEKEPSAAVFKVFAQDSSFDYRLFSTGNIDYGILKAADLIVVDALYDYPSALTGELEQFVQRGGSLFAIPAAPPAGQPDFIPDQSLCLKLIGSTRAPFVQEDLSVKRIAAEHPVFALAFSSSAANASLPLTHARYPLPTSARVSMRNLMGFSEETQTSDVGFLQLYHAGKGFLYLLASPLNKEFTDFGEHYTFVVALLNMALYRGGATEIYHIASGEEGIYFPSALFPESAGGEVYHIVSTAKTDFDLIPSLRRTGSETAFFLQGTAVEAGNYLLTDRKTLNIPLSFNYNRSESEKECMTEAALRESLRALHIKNGFVMNPDKIDLAKSVERMNRGRELWKVFLIFALVFALVETLFLRGSIKRNPLYETAKKD
ncbi:MAG: BatA domain-containing protein [Lentimicrobiaceae bacterium]|nr:BatA domain-containing protein [Lentimicrobiaceae bacterium]